RCSTRPRRRAAAPDARCARSRPAAPAAPPAACEACTRRSRASARRRRPSSGSSRYMRPAPSPTPARMEAPFSMSRSPLRSAEQRRCQLLLPPQARCGYLDGYMTVEPAAAAAFPPQLSSYPPGGTFLETLTTRVEAEPFNAIATGIFVLAILHTFAAARFAA